MKDISDKKLKIGVIGVGKRGLPLAANCANAGYITLCFDSRPIRAELINGTGNYIENYSVPNFRELWYKELLHGTTDFGSVCLCDVVFICVDDHINEAFHGDITEESALSAVGSYINKNSNIILVSVEPIKTSLEKAEKLIEKASGYSADSDFCVVSAVLYDNGHIKISASTKEDDELMEFFNNINLSS